MTIQNFVVTLTGSAQAITDSTAFCRQVFIQPGVANTNPVYVGGPGVTAANGLRLEGADLEGHPSAPLPLLFGRDNPVEMNRIYVIGTAADLVRVFAVTA